MPVVLCLLLCVVAKISATGPLKRPIQQRCDTKFQICPGLTEEGISHIREWWMKVSVQKPIKCNKSNHFKPEVDPMLWNLYDELPIFSSKKCEADEISIPFEIRGNGIGVENGVLEGGGKLKIMSEWPEDVKEEDKNKTCLRVFFAGGNSQPVEIVGNFKNGLLEGNVKLKMSDQSTIIANFQGSIMNGLRREWDVNGTLTFIGHRYRDAPVGHCWSLRFDRLVYEDCSTFGRSSSDWSLLIPFNSTLPQDLYAGTYYNNQAFLDNVHEASFTGMSSTDDCILQIDFEVGKEKQQRHFLFHEEDEQISTSFTKENSLCNFAKEDEEHKTVPGRLLKWFTKLRDYFISNPVNALTRMRTQDKPVDRDSALILLPEITLKPDVNGSYSRLINVSILNGAELPFIINNLHMDSTNRFHGFNHIILTPEADPNLVAPDPTLGWRVKSIKGYFVHGYLEGPSYVELQDGRWLIGMVKNGVLHGPQILPGTVQILPPRKSRSQIYYSHGFGYLGHYLNGRAVEHFWIGMKGEGYLHGKLDPTNHTVTGDDIAYIYPDMETSFLGKFENKFMRKAQEAFVQELDCSSDGMIIVTKYSEPSGPYFYYDPPTNESYGAGPPNTIDPYERKWLELRPSSIKGAGDGVFLRRDVPSNRAVSLYSGFFYDYPIENELYQTSRVDNTSLSDEYRRACKKYSLGMPTYQTIIDIPPEMDKPGMFQPTLGPKVNHHFRLNNSVYEEIEHPRWGTIQSVTSAIPLKAGDELFTYYGYKETSQFPADFTWYWEAKLSIEREERLEREAKEKEANVIKKGAGKKKGIKGTHTKKSKKAKKAGLNERSPEF